MQAFDSIRELRNGEWYDTASNSIMRENSSSEGSPAKNSLETNENEVPEIPTLTQDEVHELIKSFIAPLTKKLEDFSRDWKKKFRLKKRTISGIFFKIIVFAKFYQKFARYVFLSI